jgi:protein-glutamine gamma-glutamyltransferase
MRRLDIATLSKIGLYVLVAVSFLALWTGGAFSVAIGGPLVALACASWFWEKPRVDPDKFGTAWTVVTVGFIGFCIFLLVGSDEGFVRVGVYLVLYLTTAKLYQRTRLADNVQLLALSFLLIASATAFSEDVGFALWFGLYVVVGVVTFALYHLQVQLEEHRTRGGRSRRQTFGLRYLAVLVLLALVAFSSAVVFFFLFPRLGMGFFVQKSRDGVQQTGFSESVDLGTHGTIDSDNTVVMRVVADKDRLNTLPGPYWRGISFDKYDGVGWSSTLSGRRPIQPNQDYEYKIAYLTTEDPSEIVQQTIYLEPIGSNVIFGLPLILEFGLADKDKSVPAWIQARRGISLHEGDIFRVAQVPKTGLQYKVVSWPGVYDPKLLKAQTSGAGMRRHQKAAYLQLPAIEPRVTALAEQITKDAPSDWEKAVAIEAYLKANYTYTTDLPNPGAEPPLEAFLLTHKRGHCEFFATAMVIMLRSVGVYARITNGFLGGQWNDFDEFFAVRNRDAHSWVEVHLEEAWWVRFDPTPPTEDYKAGPTLWDRVYGFYDSLKFKWVKYVIEYDLETQLELLRNASNALAGSEDKAGQVSSQELRAAFADAFWSFRKNFWVGMGVLLIGLLGWFGIRVRGVVALDLRDAAVGVAAVGAGLGLVVFAWRPESGFFAQCYGVFIPLLGLWFGVARRRRPRIKVTRGHAGISKVYARLRRSVEEDGELIFAATDGPEAFAQGVRRSRIPERDEIQRIVGRYVAVRFGGAEIDDAELRQLGTSVRKLGKRLRAWRKARTLP